MQLCWGAGQIIISSSLAGIATQNVTEFLHNNQLLQLNYCPSVGRLDQNKKKGDVKKKTTLISIYAPTCPASRLAETTVSFPSVHNHFSRFFDLACMPKGLLLPSDFTSRSWWCCLEWSGRRLSLAIITSSIIQENAAKLCASRHSSSFVLTSSLSFQTWLEFLLFDFFFCFCSL